MRTHRITRHEVDDSRNSGRLCAVLALCLALVTGCGETPTEPANQAPTASFTDSCTDLTCTFDASASTDADGSVASYSWTFGDGDGGSGATPSHTFTTAGTYTATLTVTDDDGATGTTMRDVTVVAANLAPTAAFTSTCTELACDFDASASADTDGGIVSWEWDFGDGSSDSGEAVSHIYAAVGTFDVTVTVTDGPGASDTSTESITVSVPFTQLGMTLPGLTAGEQFGRSIAMSDDGTRILVGAPASSAGGSNSGQVRAFEWDGSAWSQLGQSIDGFETVLLLGDDKGITMSGDGQRIALGTPRSGPGSRGSVIVYELSGNTWLPVGSEIIAATTSQFGTGVSLSTDGSVLAVGAPAWPPQGAGSLEVYALTAGDWVQVGNAILGGDTADRLGYDVSLSGDGTRVLASLQGADVGTAPGAGKLQVYDWNGSDWVQVGGDIDGRGGFGLNASMSRDGQRVVGYAANVGDYAAVFELVGTDWAQMGPDFVVPGAFDVHQNVDLSASGDRVVIGSYSTGPDNQGIVNVYDWDGGAWVEIGAGVLGPHQSSSFGWSVSMSSDGSRFVVGMPGYNAMGSTSLGGAAVYRIN